MTPQEEKYLVAAQGQILNAVINIHAESRATKELLIVVANKNLTFPEGHTAQSYWKVLFDKAFAELSQQSKDALLKKLQ